MGMAGRNGYKAQDFIKVIPGSGGIIATIAERVGCTWKTAHKYVNELATVREAYQDECETINDKAESTLISSIEDGDVASAKWWLTKKRKSTYGESVDVTGGPFVVVNWNDDGADSSD